jgi:membrane fusion protein
MSLFRQEVMNARGYRLFGDVILMWRASDWVIGGIFLAVLTAATIWASLGTYARTTIAPGLLVTQRASSKIIAPRAGIVLKLHIKNGSYVKLGDHLVDLQVEQQNQAGNAMASESIAAIDLQIGIVTNQVGLEYQRMRLERERLLEQLAGNILESREIVEQISLQVQAVDSAKTTFEQLNELVDKGYVSKLEFERRRQAYLSQEQVLHQLQQQKLTLRARRMNAQAEYNQLGNNVARQVAELKSSAQSLTQRRVQMEMERGYAITAPISGRITVLQTAVGRYVDGRLPLMTIIPQGTSLEASVYAPSRAAGFIKPGQEVRLLYDAFPYQRFGGFNGTVTEISRTIISPADLDTPFLLKEPVYEVRIRPHAQSIKAFGDQVPLQSGMTLIANIVLDRRSFLDWLLEPLNAVRNRT